MLQVAGMVNKLGHYRGVGRLSDQYCDAGYHYDASVDNCVPGDYSIPGGYCDQPENAAECNWTYDTTPDQTIPTDNGNSQIWAQIIAAGGKIATQVLQATSTQYRTGTGLYSYGTGPYSGLTPALAQQYLASRSSIFGGISTNTMLLVGGGLLLLMFVMMKR